MIVRFLFVLFFLNFFLFGAKYSTTLELGENTISSGTSGGKSTFKIIQASSDSNADIAFTSVSKLVFVSNNAKQEFNTSQSVVFTDSVDSVLTGKNFLFLVGGYKNDGSNYLGFEQAKIEAFDKNNAVSEQDGFMFLHAYSNGSTYSLNQGGPLYFMDRANGPLMSVVNLNLNGVPQVYTAIGEGMGNAVPPVPFFISSNKVELEDVKFQARPYFSLAPDKDTSTLRFILPDSLQKYSEALIVLKGKLKTSQNFDFYWGASLTPLLSIASATVSNHPFFITKNVSFTDATEATSGLDLSDFDYVFLDVYLSGNPTISPLDPLTEVDSNVFGFNFTTREGFGFSKSGFAIKEGLNLTPNVLLHIEKTNSTHPNLHVFDVSESAKTIADFNNDLSKDSYSALDSAFYNHIKTLDIPSASKILYETIQTSLSSSGYSFGNSLSSIKFVENEQNERVL